MKHYEVMFLTHNKEARKDTDYLAEHVKGLIEKSGGTVVQLAKWDERRLAYPIKGVTHGVYFLSYLSGDGDLITKIRQEVRLSGLVLRHLALAIDAIPEKPIETWSEIHARLGGDRRNDGYDFEAPRGGGRRPPRSERPAFERSREAAPVGVGDDEPDHGGEPAGKD